MRLGPFLIILSIFCWGRLGFSYQYRIQPGPLDSAQSRILQALTLQLKTWSFSDVRPYPEKPMDELMVHQIFLSLTERKVVGLVFLENQNPDLPGKMQLQDATVLHLPFRHSTLAIWMQGLSRDESETLQNWVKRQIALETPSLWKELLPNAHAEKCVGASDKKPFNELTQKLQESSGSLCWKKFGEGAESYGKSLQENIKSKLNFDLAEYWQQFKSTVSGLIDFARDFGGDPMGWVKKHAPDADSFDLSGLGEISKDQILGLACLSLGHDGASSLVSGLARGPAGLGIKASLWLRKILSVTKLFKILKTLSHISGETMELFKGKFVALAEKLIKQEESSDKVDSISGLLKMSPSMAQEGFACMGI